MLTTTAKNSRHGQSAKMRDITPASGLKPKSSSTSLNSLLQSTPHLKIVVVADEVTGDVVAISDVSARQSTVTPVPPQRTESMYQADIMAATSAINALTTTADDTKNATLKRKPALLQKPAQLRVSRKMSDTPPPAASVFLSTEGPGENKQSKSSTDLRRKSDLALNEGGAKSQSTLARPGAPSIIKSNVDMAERAQVAAKMFGPPRT